MLSANNNGVKFITTQVKIQQPPKPCDKNSITYLVSLIAKDEDLFLPIKKNIPTYSGSKKDRREFYRAACDRMLLYFGCVDKPSYGRFQRYLSYLQMEVRKPNNDKDRTLKLQKAYTAVYACLGIKAKKNIPNSHPVLYNFMAKHKVYKSSDKHRQDEIRRYHKKKANMLNKKTTGPVLHTTKHLEEALKEQLNTEKKIINETEFFDFQPINNHVDENNDVFDNNINLNDYFNDDNHTIDNNSLNQITNLQDNKFNFIKNNYLNK